MKLQFAVLALGMLAAGASVAGGVGSTGGGNAVVCLNTDGSIKSAELLDLWEARELYGGTLLVSHDDARTQAIAAGARIDNGHATDMKNYLPITIDKIHFLPPRTELVHVDDSDEVAHPTACPVVQLARYEANGDLFVNSDIWAHLDEQSRAALYVHEALYFQLRMYGEKTSVRTRRAVGAAFAGLVFPSFADFEVQGAMESCFAGDSNGHSVAAFWSFPNPTGGITLQFMFYNSSPMLSKTTVDLKTLKWPLSDYKDMQIEGASLNSIVDQGDPVLLYLNPPGLPPHFEIGSSVDFMAPRYELKCTKLSIPPK